jgi:hypothetical protein
MIAKYMTANNTTKYVNKIDDLLEAYNTSPHSSLGDYSPQQFIEDNKAYNLAKKINLVSKNPKFYQLDLDYLQLQDDPTIKCFMEKNHSIQLVEKNTKIKQLQKIIEKKCETIEQLNAELTKQKNNFASW